MMHDHGDILEKVRRELPTDELLSDLSDLFKIFGDTTRCKILYALFESEMCVCAITSAPYSEGRGSGRQASGGQDHLLLSLGRPRAHHHCPGL